MWRHSENKLLRFRLGQQTAGLLYSRLCRKQTEVCSQLCVLWVTVFITYYTYYCISLIISYWKKFKCQTQSSSTTKDRWAGFFWSTQIHTRNFDPVSQKPFLHSVSVLTPEWWFANCPLMVIHTERSISAIPPWKFTQKAGTAAPKEAWQYTSCWWRQCFPGVPPVNLNPWTVYNHMDAVIICSDWDPDPPNILESDKVTLFALNCIIT